MTDRIIQKKHPMRKYYLAVAGGAMIIVLLVWVLNRKYSGELNVSRNKVSVSVVTSGEFGEYIVTDGTVLPVKTIYLDAVEGGRVAERYVQDGARVTEGQPILKLVNTDLQLDFLQRETQAFDLINNLQNARNSLENTKVTRLTQLADAEFQLKESERLYEVNEKLFNDKLIGRQEYLQYKNTYEYNRRKKQLIEKAILQDSVTAYEQMKQMRESYSRMQSNLKLMKQKTEDLIVRAPASGQISSFRAEIGELKTKGQSLGQLDILNGYKVRAQLDEHYISRIVNGQNAEFDFNGATYKLQVRTIYPQVVNGKFDADMEFVAAQPAGIRKGQNLQLRLQLGGSTKTLRLSKGGFYQSTGGNWVYVLNEDGSHAEKRNIKTGRQNPEYYEITEGLAAGEQVITSSYETLGEYDRINLID
jgi:HlyD family secretion protein